MINFLQHIMKESSNLEEENIIKDVRNLYRLEKLKKEITDATTKGNLYKKSL